MLRFIFLLIGTAFGFVLIQSGVSNFNVIQDMFLFKSFHLYGVLGVAVISSFIGIQIIKFLKTKSLLQNVEIEMKNDKPDKNHLIGGIIAGLGWALTGACPGPAMAQIGFGTLAGIFTVIGIFVGVYFHGRSVRPL